jgi:predicted metal-dependent HD superfamily phosphohydrolase
MSNLYELNQKWQQCWVVDGVITLKHRSSQQQLDLLFQLLTTAYSTPDRYYHNLQHLHQVLTTIDRFTLQLQNPIAVKLAAWFHDVVYNPQAADNEYQSAQLANKLLTELQLAPTLIDQVQHLILATKGHQTNSTDLDLSIFLDADLAILGTPPDQYQTYARSIRKEYSWVTDAAYKTGRTRVLESFLCRDRLYCTDLLFDELESIARFNLSQEIAGLVV